MSTTRRFWPPSLTSQFLICPVPFHVDSYRGCVHNCTYCFARDFTTFHRNLKAGTLGGKDEPTLDVLNAASPEKKAAEPPRPFTALDGNDPEGFAKWCRKAKDKKPALTDSAAYYFHENVPLKFGATSDPCPVAELKEGISRAMLRTLKDLGHPTEIQTKNPAVLERVLDGMEGANFTISVSLIMVDEAKMRIVEPGAPTPRARLEAIRRLVDRGFPVFVKCQPALYPMILEEVEPLVEAVAAAGCWAFQMEGLKVRVTMPKEEKAIFAAVERVGGTPPGMTALDFYRSHGVRTGSDYELRHDLKVEYHRKGRELTHAKGLVYFAADNDCARWGDSPECCGTEKLRDYRTLRLNLRTIAHDTREALDREAGPTTVSDLAPWHDDLSDVVIDFTRNDRLRGKTIFEAVREEVEKNGLEQATGKAPIEEGDGILSSFFG